MEEPSPNNPNPEQDTSNGQEPRYRCKSYHPPHVRPEGDALAQCPRIALPHGGILSVVPASAMGLVVNFRTFHALSV